MPDIDRTAEIKVTAARGTVAAEIPLAGHASEDWLELFAGLREIGATAGPGGRGPGGPHLGHRPAAWRPPGPQSRVGAGRRTCADRRSHRPGGAVPVECRPNRGRYPQLVGASTVAASSALILSDPLIRRSFQAGRQPARAQVGGCSYSPWVTAGDRSFPSVLARMWHGHKRPDVSASATACSHDVLIDLTPGQAASPGHADHRPASPDGYAPGLGRVPAAAGHGDRGGELRKPGSLGALLLVLGGLAEASYQGSFPAGRSRPLGGARGGAIPCPSAACAGAWRQRSSRPVR